MKIRIKFHDFPGDVPKHEKIQMLEDKNHPLHKEFVKILKLRERAAFKRQTEQLISEQE